MGDPKSPVAFVSRASAAYIYRPYVPILSKTWTPYGYWNAPILWCVVDGFGVNSTDTLLRKLAPDLTPDDCVTHISKHCAVHLTAWANAPANTPRSQHLGDLTRDIMRRGSKPAITAPYCD